VLLAITRAYSRASAAAGIFLGVDELLYYTSGAFVLVLSILRIVVLRFRETPKYLSVADKTW
jgi:hypothetical protein